MLRFLYGEADFEERLLSNLSILGFVMIGFYCLSFC